MPNRKLARVKSSPSPRALRTWLGSGLALVHALPLETAIVLMLIIRASPFTSGKAQLRLPGNRMSCSVPLLARAPTASAVGRAVPPPLLCHGLTTDACSAAKRHRRVAWGLWPQEQSAHSYHLAAAKRRREHERTERIASSSRFQPVSTHGKFEKGWLRRGATLERCSDRKHRSATQSSRPTTVVETHGYRSNLATRGRWDAAPQEVG